MEPDQPELPEHEWRRCLCRVEFRVRKDSEQRQCATCAMLNGDKCDGDYYE